MTTRYRVEYALKSHRRDQFIEWIKGLLAVPFVLHSQPTAKTNDLHEPVTKMASIAHERYAEILRSVEDLVNDHIRHQSDSINHRSKLKRLVPSVGMFFTPLALEKAFAYQDGKRKISSRRFVPPSFNDIRLVCHLVSRFTHRLGPSVCHIEFYYADDYQFSAQRESLGALCVATFEFH